MRKLAIIAAGGAFIAMTAGAGAQGLKFPDVPVYPANRSVAAVPAGPSIDSPALPADIVGQMLRNPRGDVIGRIVGVNGQTAILARGGKRLALTHDKFWINGSGPGMDVRSAIEENDLRNLPVLGPLEPATATAAPVR